MKSTVCNTTTRTLDLLERTLGRLLRRAGPRRRHCCRRDVRGAAGCRGGVVGRRLTFLVCQWCLLRDAKRTIHHRAAALRSRDQHASYLVLGYLIDGANGLDCGGAFYSAVSNGYKVIPPPIGSTVTTLPNGAQADNIKGVVYFHFGGAYYRPFYSGSSVIYEVVAKPS